MNGHTRVLDADRIGRDLDERGWATVDHILDAEQCARLRSWFDEDEHFRATVDMERHRFGRGRYRYFDDPVPTIVADLRAEFYRALVPTARRWADLWGDASPWPDELEPWLARCHAAGQTRPTPILLRYEDGDWNALHQDLYGELVFPLQVVVGLDRPGVDYGGGEFLFVEQRPRAQSRATAVTIGLGQALVFATRARPVHTARGYSRGPVRHGVSTVVRGPRHTLGLVLHDAT